MSGKKLKQNCWEFKKCGRERGGSHEKELGRCPATLEARLDGNHDGTNGGRACWIIAGTLCKGEIQGTFAQKFGNCTTCDFYKLVKSEEFPSFKLSSELLAKLN